MLLKVDVAMMLVSLTLGVGVASVVALQNEETEPVGKLAGSRAAVEETVEKDKKQREFEPGKKLEINDKPESETGWPEPTSSEEVGSADAPRYYQSSPDTNSRQTLKESKRRLDKKKAEYEKSREERRARAEELRRSEGRLIVSIAKLVSSPQQMEEHIQQLEDAEEAGEFTQPPASGGGGTRTTTVEQELEIAEEDIVARPVEPIPFKRYVQIYKAAAKRYGFAEDWYVLAAVGKVESNHGENIGPSSAGAMGPMQFLPSTWEQYSVDGNGDGEENVMDPRDAIPAAASYLADGGAPEDWPKALYTYNHSGQYVREVLGIAESYKRQAEEAEEDEVQPDD